MTTRSHQKCSSKPIRRVIYNISCACTGNQALDIKTNDTIIVIIAVYILPQVQEFSNDISWTAFCHGVGMQLIPIFELLKAIPSARASEIIMFPFLHWVQCGICLQKGGTNWLADNGISLIMSPKHSANLSSFRLRYYYYTQVRKSHAVFH